MEQLHRPDTSKDSAPLNIKSMEVSLELYRRLVIKDNATTLYTKASAGITAGCLYLS